LEACRKDFRNFKKNNGNKIVELLDEQITQLGQLGLDPKIINSQNDNIENIRKLIKEGKEDVAFSIFYRTFPSCLPYRSRRTSI
jgi:hypothetical protein